MPASLLPQTTLRNMAAPQVLFSKLFLVTMTLADELQINVVPHHVKAYQDNDCQHVLLQKDTFFA